MTRLAFIHRRSTQIIVWLLLAFFVYLMGTLSVLHPATKQEALHFTPIALLLTTTILFFFAQTSYSYKFIFTFTLIAILGFLVEWTGVQTGYIFGKYEYTHYFGIRCGGTPLLIGINWLFLSYAWAAITHNTAFAPRRRILYAAIGMLAYDLLLEKAAPIMELWYWQDTKVPVSNYIAWFLIALFFQWLIHRNQIVTHNSMALPLLFLQILMFIFIILYSPPSSPIPANNKLQENNFTVPAASYIHSSDK